MPYFKLRWINNFKTYLKEGQDINEQIQNIIIDAVKNLNLKENVAENSVDTKFCEEDEFFELEEDLVFSASRRDLKRKAELEFLQYLNDLDSQITSLNSYPTMKRLFYKYNTCLPSSAPVERLFSFAEIINAPRRHALSDAHFEQLVLLKANRINYK